MLLSGTNLGKDFVKPEYGRTKRMSTKITLEMTTKDVLTTMGGGNPGGHYEGTMREDEENYET